MNANLVIIIDCGSTYLRNLIDIVKENNYIPVVLPYKTDYSSTIAPMSPDAIIISGSGLSVMSKKAPKPDKDIFAQADTPVLGVCYGMQYMAHALGGKVKSSAIRERGATSIYFNDVFQKKKEKKIKIEKSTIYEHFTEGAIVWMSHACTITKMPENFVITSLSENGLIASIERGNLIGVQYHPEKRRESGVYTGEGNLVMETFFDKIVKKDADNDAN